MLFRALREQWERRLGDEEKEKRGARRDLALELVCLTSCPAEREHPGAQINHPLLKATKFTNTTIKKKPRRTDLPGFFLFIF